MPGLGTQAFGTSSLGGARNIRVAVSAPRSSGVTVSALRSRALTATARPQS